MLKLPVWTCHIVHQNFEDDNSSKYDGRLDGGIQSYFLNQWKILYQKRSNDNDRSEEENLERLSNLT